MKRRKLDGDEDEQEKEEEKVMTPIDLIRASVLKGETHLNDWRSALEALESEANLFAIRGELARNLPRLFKGTPLEDLVTSPGKISLFSVEKWEETGRDATTNVSGTFSLSLGIDEELKPKYENLKKEEEQGGGHYDRMSHWKFPEAMKSAEGDLPVSFDLNFREDDLLEFWLMVGHCETRKILPPSKIPYIRGEHFPQRPVVDEQQFLQFLKSQGLRLPSPLGKNEMSVLRCLIWLLNYIITKCICDGQFELEDDWLVEKLQSEMLKPSGEETQSTEYGGMF